MKVSFFSNIYSITPSRDSKDVLHYLNRIKTGKSQKIVQLIRDELIDEKRTVLKEKLPAVCFAGEFTKRSKDGLKRASGLLTLDFDKLDNPIEFKNELKENNKIYSCWISPSGNGVKALVKIPVVDDYNEYEYIYNQVIKDFDNVDPSGKDISRLCFESFDNDLYLNEDSEIYEIDLDVSIFEDNSLGTITNIPLIDQNEIANRLIKWFKSKYNHNQRNCSLYKLAMAFNDFGVDKITSENYLYSFEQQDFKRSEIDKIIKSAYKQSANFGSKFFEDTKTKSDINNYILTGKKEKEIIEIYQDKYSKENIVEEIKLQKSKINIDEFWVRDEKGKLDVSSYRFKVYLESLNYAKFYPKEGSKAFVLIKKDDNFLDIVSEFDIKDDILNRLVANNQIEVFDLVADKLPLFSEKYLSMVKTNTDVIQRDTKECSYLYYENTAIEVSKDGIKKIPYTDLENSIWKSQVINRDFVDADHHDSEFRSFIWFASGKNKEKYNTLKSVIGYLLHGWKTSANNRAIIFNDETISDNPNGGSGKGMITNALGYMKKVSVIDGKNFDFGKSFAFQTINTDTQIVCFDDVKKNFDFERLFSIITEGITLEYKNEGAVKMSLADSPKVVVNTNYTIKTDGDSFKRRVFEVEMSSYFSSSHTPLDEFGRMLFDDWDSAEWERFDKFMINCLQYYLENGLIQAETKNLGLRKFINETSQEFYEYTEQDHLVPLNIRLTKRDVLEKYHEDFPDSRKFVKIRTLVKWMKKYAEFKNYEYRENNTNGQRWFMLVSDDSIIDLEDENDLPF